MKKPISIKIIGGIHLLFSLLFIVSLYISANSYNTLVNFENFTLVFLFSINVFIGISMIKGSLFGWGSSIIYFIIQLFLRIKEFRFDMKLIILSIIIYSIPLIYLFQGNVLKYFGINKKFKVDVTTFKANNNKQKVLFGLIMLIEFLLSFYLLCELLTLHRGYSSYINRISIPSLEVKGLYMASLYYIVMIITSIISGIGVLLKKAWSWHLSAILFTTILINKIFDISYVSITLAYLNSNLIVKNLFICSILVCIIIFLFKDSTIKGFKIQIDEKFKEGIKLGLISLIISIMYAVKNFL